MRTYHIGFIKGSGECYPLHRNGHKEGTLIVQARRDKDFLSCDLWKYLGEFEITKKQLRKNIPLILEDTNKRNNTNFTHCIID